MKLSTFIALNESYSLMTAPCKSAAAFPSQGLLPTTVGREVLPEQGTAPAWAFPAQCHIPAGRSPELWEQSNMGCQAWGRRGVLAVPSPTWQEGSRDRGKSWSWVPIPASHRGFTNWDGSQLTPRAVAAVDTASKPWPPRCHPQISASPPNLSVIPEQRHHP